MCDGSRCLDSVRSNLWASIHRAVSFAFFPPAGRSATCADGSWCELEPLQMAKCEQLVDPRTNPKQLRRCEMTSSGIPTKKSSHISMQRQGKGFSFSTMATTTTTQPQSPPPSPYIILVLYVFLGTVLSYTVGRTPVGRLPDDILRELAPTLLVICAFITSYSLFDVMAVGIAKADPANSKHDPDLAYLAQRVLTNQIEQLPVFLVGSLGCALLVNGTAAAVLALAWTILRRCYAVLYRNGVGRPLATTLSQLTVTTIPAYFVAHTMLMATAIHVVRYVIASSYM